MIKSYGPFIAGQDQDGENWTYAIRASALIDDPRGAFELKRSLELGEGSESEDDERVFGRCAIASRSQLDEAIQAAADCRRTWAQFPIDAKKQIGIELHHELERRSNEMVDLLVAEGHPKKLALWEMSGALRGCDPQSLDWYFADFERTTEIGGRRLTVRRRPDGVVCVNPPQNAAGSNSALAVLAVLAGNSIVVKAPRSTPISVMFFWRDIMHPILERHSAPPGVVNLIAAETRLVLKHWLEHPGVDDVLFFGSSDTGIDFGAECVARGKKPILELSGNDSVVVWNDADLDAAAEAMAECFYGSSQICMVPKRGVVHPDVADEFLGILIDRVKRLRPGFPEDPEVVLSPVLKADQYFDYLSQARESSSAEILCGGSRLDVYGHPASGGFFLEPSIVRVDGFEAALELSCVTEETFFPLLPIVVPESAPTESLLESTIDFLNSNRYGLRNSLWAKDQAVIDQVLDGTTNGGMLKVNDSHIGFVPILSTHGGTGRTGGPFGEMNFLMFRTSHTQGISEVIDDIAVSPFAEELAAARS